MATTRTMIILVLLILGGGCAVFGAFTVAMGHGWEWAVALITCALLFLGMLTKRRPLEDPLPPTDSDNSQRVKAEDLGSMTPPGWDAIPPTIGMAAQPDAYFQKRKGDR